MLGYFKGLHARATAKYNRYKKNDEGVAAVEFAIVSIPFFMLVFGIIELAIIFFINSTMSHAVSEAGRLIRVGSFQSCGGADKFKETVCDLMDNMAGCMQNLRVDVISQPTFEAISMPDPTEPDGNPPPPGTYNNTNASDPVVVRALFYYKLALPSTFTRLESSAGTGVRILGSTTAFRNEPFPAPGACPL